MLAQVILVPHDLELSIAVRAMQPEKATDRAHRLTLTLAPDAFDVFHALDYRNGSARGKHKVQNLLRALSPYAARGWVRAGPAKNLTPYISRGYEGDED